MPLSCGHFVMGEAADASVLWSQHFVMGEAASVSVMWSLCDGGGCQCLCPVVTL